jgi:hypothetical protein
VPDGDGEPHVELPGGEEHGLAVERRVRAHGQRPGGAGVPNPADRLGQERRRAAGGAGAAPAQPTEQHLPGLRAGRQLRVVAADLGAAEPGALLATAVDRADRESMSMVSGALQVRRAGAGRPRWGQQFSADRVEQAPSLLVRGAFVRYDPRPATIPAVDPG